MRAEDEIKALVEKLVSGDIDPDEPLFYLRGRDLLAAGAVTCWAVCARAVGSPDKRVSHAMETAEAMRSWHVHRVPGKPDSERGSVQK